MLEGSDEQFREKLRLAQGQCKELRPLLEARSKLLGATHKESVRAAEELAKDYSFNPEYGTLERTVFIIRARI
jgi:hypothetical protein